MTVMTLNWIFIAIVLLSMIVGFIRGTLMTFLATIFWIIAVVGVIIYNATISSWFSHVPVISGHADLSGSIIAMIIVLVVGAIIMRLIKLINVSSSTGMASRFIGALIAFIRGLLCVMALVFLIGMTTLSQKPYWQHSQIVQAINPWISQLQQEGIQGVHAKVTSIKTGANSN